MKERKNMPAIRSRQLWSKYFDALGYSGELKKNVRYRNLGKR